MKRAKNKISFIYMKKKYRILSKEIIKKDIDNKNSEKEKGNITILTFLKQINNNKNSK